MKMKNIKFKAKSLNSGEWVVGDLAHRITDTCIAVKDMDDIVYYPVDPATVCQFTGLKDCDGKELYEHDVVENYPFIPSEIVWSEDLSGYFLTRDDGKIYEKPLGYYLLLGEFIVVGNKFDNEK